MTSPTHFYCPGCSRHRPLERRGTHKAGNHHFCIDCEAKSANAAKRYRNQTGRYFAGIDGRE